MSEWQPIETAPKDGTEILAYVVQEPDDYTDAVGAPEGWANVDIGRFDMFGEWAGQWAGVPTHWMPLPDPPQQPRDQSVLRGHAETDDETGQRR